MTDLTVSAALRKRVTESWNASTDLGIPDDKFWEHVAAKDAVMAEVWQAVRREVDPDPDSVLGKLLLDAESYRHSQVNGAKEHMRVAAQTRGGTR